MVSKKLSIIIATYNVASSIEKCLDSILSQTFQDYEVIIVDGASRDETADIIAHYRDTRIKFISEPDNGIYDAWNKGISLSNGEWLAFIGADDCYSSSSSLQLLIDSIPVSDDAPIIYGKIHSEGPAGDITGEGGEPWFDVFSLKFNYLKCRLPIPVMSAIYSRNFIKNEKFDLALKVTADADLLLRCLRRWKGNPPYFIASDKPIVRMGYGGISTNRKTYIITLKNSLKTRRKNGISNINLAMMVRVIKVYMILAVGRFLGDSFLVSSLAKYHLMKKKVRRVN
ncbi:glycosyltransferase family 2 protein [[Erwinia] mediterraneensis]|uniref:glycosyltransferase family 2 protein n=1 Tax=[Erwinia] mediterraneensis TaxID=2161819 RepID=UPI001032563B|nr:glycosyltransferase family 2 protein [[Erwinia] mediterraneensis]